ncbi:MAG: diadenylate cyclase [Desulfosarcinaceae bacterium]|nr:diadenylate cyclase [Desulfosarcinaceae bacterium]
MDLGSSFIAAIRWQDAVDILLNSYILFRLYVLFRGTNVIRVIVGIAFLWVFQRVAVAMGLIVTSWAMQGIIAGAALIIIIVFRNEIRSVLQAKNLRGLLWGFPYAAERPPLEVISESVYELARRRIGALIVLPAKDDLEDTCQGGLAWKGQLSKEMLLSIFWNGNPVHDGAVVLQGRQVQQVGTILPLSKREDLPSYYGTRHRAAVGLAEVSDALVVVVSEERGQVVVAKGGELLPIQDNLQLEEILANHGARGLHPRAESWRDKLELGTAALVSTICVLGIWFSFARGLETFTSLEIPIEYMNRSSSMEIFGASVNTINLNLSGSGALIRSLNPDQVKVKLDLSRAKVGPNSYTITREDIDLPPGINLKSVAPATVEVTLDVPVEKELPIQADWSGKLPENLILESVKLVPERVRVVGGSQILKEIDTLYTDKLPLNTLKTSGAMTTRLALQPGTLKIADGARDKVVVRFTLRERRVR